MGGLFRLRPSSLHPPLIKETTIVRSRWESPGGSAHAEINSRKTPLQSPVTCQKLLEAHRDVCGAKKEK